jgi:UDPglucose--hexose-1-phosphate uridylyltransferase
MTDLYRLARSIKNTSIWCRKHIKLDGRALYLYADSPPNLPPLVEESSELPKGGEIRYHPLRNEWNVYASHRQNRTFKPTRAQDPLAPSNLKGSPTEIPFENFQIAVFENKFAAFHSEAKATKTLDYLKVEPAEGKSEVVVYDPQPEGSLYTIGQDRRRVLLAAILDRYENLFAIGCNYVLPFENRGDEVGVTLHHPHGQIYGFKRIPEVQKRTITAFSNGYKLENDLGQILPNYGIGESGGIAAFVPPFARFPYEIWLTPQKRREGPWDCSDEELDSLAHWLGEITRRYDVLFEGSAATMMAFHAAPSGGSRGFHFTVQFYPLLRAPHQIKYLASVEQHTGTFTVDVLPETAVKALSNV